MIVLLAGVTLWTLVHWIPGMAPQFRQRCVASIGTAAYRGCFAGCIVLAIVLIVTGWRSTAPEQVYLPSMAMRQAGMGLVLLAFISLGAFRGKGKINQWLRHPQLTGVLLWAAGHLLANGEQRSLLLFSGMFIWAAVNILLINRREGARERPLYGGIAYDIRAFLVGSILFVIVLFAHPWVTGVALV